MRTANATATSTIQVDRRRLLEALNRIKLVTPNTTPKPVLQGVRLEASNGDLTEATYRTTDPTEKANLAMLEMRARLVMDVWKRRVGVN